jgi:hypothetical protein
MICQNCKIEVNNLSHNCPLCGKHLPEETKEENRVYPDVEKMDKGKGKQYIKLLLFLSIVLSISSFTVNMLTPHINLWSVTAIFGMWLAWLVVGIPIVKGRLTPMMIIIDDITISIFLYVVDRTFGNLGWAMDYAVPFVLCGSALVITVIVIAVKINWREFYLFQLAIVVICAIPLILREFMDFVLWPSIVSAIYGILTFIGIIILGNRKIKYETKKRLHL